MVEKVFLAVDLGASSGRLMAGLFDGARLELTEVSRFDNGPVMVADHLHWDLLSQWNHIRAGLRAAGRLFGSAIESVGVDTWGVDFGLLGRGDELLGNPYHYRDQRTQGVMERACAIVDREEIFAETGLQFLPFNTIFQLLAMRWSNSSQLEAAESFLMMPDLFHWLLSGEKSTELTNASTTQLYNPRRRDWAWNLHDRLDLPRRVFGSLAEPGTSLGALRPEVASDSGLTGVQVVLPATHDTASAVMSVPATVTGATDWCYISSGTWSLMGVEVAQPVINATAARYNFTNEGGVAGTTRLLKNIMGLWLVQECRRIWQREGRDYTWDQLTQMAREAAPLGSVIHVDDAELLAPADMPAAIRQACRRLGQPQPESAGAVIRCALESIALRCRQVFSWLEEIVGQRIETIHIVGGGTQNRLLCQWTADACGRPVVAGPVEATAVGNLMMQAVAAGDVGSVAEARAVIRASFEVVRYEPAPTAPWAEALTRLGPAAAD